MTTRPLIAIAALALALLAPSAAGAEASDGSPQTALEAIEAGAPPTAIPAPGQGGLWMGELSQEERATVLRYLGIDVETQRGAAQARQLGLLPRRPRKKRRHASTASAPHGSLAEVRASTAGFHEIDSARDAGYALFPDAQGIECIDQPGDGGMGIHFVNLGDVLDNEADAATPEALVYEPQPNGRLRLVAVEYVVFKDAWDATHSSPPSLFGEDFEELPAPNRYGLPAIYELHAWVFKHNPSGMFNDWNPRVSCDAS